MLGLFLNRLVRQGTLTIVDPNGRRRDFGAGPPQVTIKFHDRRAMFELALHPDLKLGELYMDGRLTVEQGDVADLLALLMKNLSLTKPVGLHRGLRAFRSVTRRFSQFNPASRAKAHVAHHYDLLNNGRQLGVDMPAMSAFESDIREFVA